MATTKWVIDTAHSEVTFKVRHLMISYARGNFKSFDSTLETDGDDIANGKVVFTAKIDSINTGNEQRDTHLKSDDFFNAEQYPELRFEGHGLKKISDTDYEVDGNLTIRDVTKPVKVAVEFGGLTKDPWGNTRLGFSIETKINRKDYGLRWDAVTETGGVVVSDDIKIEAEVEYIKQ